MPVKDKVPTTAPCSAKVVAKNHYEYRCSWHSPWIPSAPNFIGGPTTGAKKE